MNLRFNTIRFVIDVYGIGNELLTVFNNLSINANSAKFIETYGFEDYMCNPGGPEPQADYSRFDQFKINFTVEEPQQRFRKGM
mgnify:FL=1